MISGGFRIGVLKPFILITLIYWTEIETMPIPYFYMIQMKFWHRNEDFWGGGMSQYRNCLEVQSHGRLRILLHVDLLLGNDYEICNYATAVAR
jgi:hypothetical protein